MRFRIGVAAECSHPGATAFALTFAISAIGEAVPDGRPFPGALYIGQIVLAAFMLPLCAASDLSCGAR